MNTDIFTSQKQNDNQSANKPLMDGKEQKDQDKKRFQAIVDYVNKVVTTQRDIYHGTPLFADAVNVETGELFKWKNAKDDELVVSDFATQQNFMRLLTGLSVLTGNKAYKKRALAAAKYMLDHHMSEDHLLYWGGHTYVNLETQEAAGPDNKEMVHELKNCFPYYDLMFEADAEKTSQFIEAFWNAHIYDWEELEVGRHGEHRSKPQGYPFNHELIEKEPHRTSTGLSFLNAGNDLIYAAAKYYEHNQDKNAYKWAEFLARQYVEARDPVTKLGAYQFTQKIQSIDPVINNIPDTDTNSQYGDRARRQFGHRFPDALESKMLLNSAPSTIYGINTLMQLQLYLEVGETAEKFKNWSIEGMLAFVKYMYNAEDYTVKPMMTDGTDLTGYRIEKDGYYNKKGVILEPVKINSNYLLAAARAYLVIKDDSLVSAEDKKILWRAVRSMAKGLELGDIGEISTGEKEAAEYINVNLETENCDGKALFAVLDLYKITGHEEVLNLARAIGDNIIENCCHNGYFTLGKDYIYGEVDMVEPFAVLALEAAIQHKSELMPAFINGKGFLEGNYKLPDGTMKNLSTMKIYAMKRTDKSIS